LNDLLVLELTNSNLFSITKPATHGPMSMADTIMTDIVGRPRLWHCRSTFWLPTLNVGHWYVNNAAMTLETVSAFSNYSSAVFWRYATVWVQIPFSCCRWC